MYHSHFGLKEEPFGVTPDPRFFYQTPQHREAISTLFYALHQRRGFALLVGPPGVGKTSVLFTVVRMLKGSAQIAYLANPCYDSTSVLDAILAAYGLIPAESRAASQRLFYQFLLRTRDAGKTCVVIFDEAQELDRDTLESIRLLSNFETPEGKLVQIVLAGQPALAETLRRPDCEQIRQRLNAISRIGPLSRSEVGEYIGHRIETAGGSPALISPAAIEAIASASGGVPRNVNTIAFNALSLGFALNREQIGPAEILEATCDLTLPAGAAATGPAVPHNDVSGTVGEASSLCFAQAGQSFVPVWIAGGLTVLAASVLFLAQFS
jgi:general secretion pathway protein A